MLDERLDWRIKIYDYTTIITQLFSSGSIHSIHTQIVRRVCLLVCFQFNSSCVVNIYHVHSRRKLLYSLFVHSNENVTGFFFSYVATKINQMMNFGCPGRNLIINVIFVLKHVTIILKVFTQ